MTDRVSSQDPPQKVNEVVDEDQKVDKDQELDEDHEKPDQDRKPAQSPGQSTQAGTDTLIRFHDSLVWQVLSILVRILIVFLGLLFGPHELFCGTDSAYLPFIYTANAGCLLADVLSFLFVLFKEISRDREGPRAAAPQLVHSSYGFSLWIATFMVAMANWRTAEFCNEGRGDCHAGNGINGTRLM